MTRQWVLIAHRSGARVFEKQVKKGMALLQRFHNPGVRRPTMTGMKTASEDLQNQVHLFAKTIGKFIESGRSQGKFDRLVLVAEPKFLGMVRAALSPRTLATVNGTVDRDYTHLPDQLVFDRLKNSLVI